MNVKLREAINGLIDEQVKNGELEEDVIDDLVDYLTYQYEWRNTKMAKIECKYCGAMVFVEDLFGCENCDITICDECSVGGLCVECHQTESEDEEE